MTDGKRKLSSATELLSAEERARRYRAAATEAFGRADSAQDSVLRAEYFEMAAGWHNLAFETERRADPAEELVAKKANAQVGRTKPSHA
jgi:hypothetical protein